MENNNKSNSQNKNLLKYKLVTLVVLVLVIAGIFVYSIYKNTNSGSTDTSVSSPEYYDELLADNELPELNGINYNIVNAYDEEDAEITGIYIYTLYNKSSENLLKEPIKHGEYVYINIPETQKSDEFDLQIIGFEFNDGSIAECSLSDFKNHTVTISKSLEEFNQFTPTSSSTPGYASYATIASYDYITVSEALNTEYSRVDIIVKGSGAASDTSSSTSFSESSVTSESTSDSVSASTEDSIITDVTDDASSSVASEQVSDDSNAIITSSESSSDAADSTVVK